MRIANLLLCICLVFFSVLDSKSQRANYWYFGANAGLNFNTTPPSVLTNGQTNGPDNTSTISDASGNLLFYTNGLTVWNNQHSAMPNGTGLVGNISAGQCALIVPIPCDPNKYVIFHVTEYSSPGYLNYSVVDMSLNGGLGDVVSSQKNVSLGSGWTEKLCAYYNAAGNNYWVLTHKWNSDQFVAFSVNSLSIAATSVTTSIGSTHNCGTYGSVHDAMGQLTISPDGTKVLNALTCQDKYELFDFNVATGVLSNSISITGTGGYAWGTAFSPDSKRIYTDAIFGLTILQYDINTYTQASILASQYTVASVAGSGYNFGYMELGPDAKLYIAKPSSGTLSVVNNPNAVGSACNFSLTGQSLGSKSSNHGISRIAYNIPGNSGGFSVVASPNATLGCTSQILTLTASPPLVSSSYTWSGPGISGSVTGNSISIGTAGVYTCLALGCSGSLIPVTYTVYNSASIPALLVSASASSVCAGSLVTLNVSGANTYTWQPVNLTGSVISVTPSVSANYTVTGTSSLGCTSNATLSITVLPNPNVLLLPLTQTLCAGQTLTVTQTGASSYTWQPGNVVTTGSQVVFTPSVSTVYTINGANSQGCRSTMYNTVTVNSLPNVSVSPLTNTFCSSSSLSFSASGASSYTWYPAGSSGSVLTVLPPLLSSNYTVTGLSIQGCTATVIKSTTVIPSPAVVASSNPPVSCGGGTVLLSGSGATNYTWQPGGITGQMILVNPSSTTIYTVTGEGAGCSGTATVIVSNPLSPSITSAGNIDCNNPITQLYITANSTTYTTLWSGPGIAAGVSSASVQVNAAGVYTAVLTDTVTGCSATSTISVSNNIGPVPVNIIPSTTLSCFPGPPVNLLVSSSASYTWFPSAAVSPSTGPVVSVNPSVTTVYSVVATLGVCSGSSAITISVNTTPTLTLSSSNNTLCAGSTATLSASGASSYIWIPGNSLGATVTLTPLSTTAYTVTGYNGICQSSSQTTLKVFPLPSLITSISPSIVCAGNTVTLTAAGGELLGWTSNNTFSAQPTILVTPSVTGVYLASGTNSMGCKSVQAVTVNVINLPVPIVFSSANTICSGGSVTLTAGGGTSYTWLPVNQTGSVVVITPSVTTLYTLALQNSGCTNYTTVLIQTEECFGSNFGVTKACSIPELFNGNYYKISFSVTAVNGSSQDFRNVSLNDDLSQTFPSPCTYSIEGIPRLNSSGSGLKPNPLFDGRSELSLTAPNSSTLFAGRRDTLVFIVLLDPHGFYGSLKNSVIGFANSPTNQLLSDSSNTGFVWDPDKDGDPTNNNEPTLFEIGIIELFIPEGFSPNDDGINDVFEIKGLQGRKLNLTIFNRWGNKVYIKDNYDNSWDGRPNVNSVHFGNSRLPEGTYYFLIQFTDGNKEIMHGFVVLRY